MNNTDSDLILRARKMNSVYRCSGTRLNRPYSLTEHGFHVAELLHILSRRIGVTVTGQDMFLAMNHDLMETETGDLLYPAKNLNETTKISWGHIEEQISHRIPALAPFEDRAIHSKMSSAAVHALFRFCDMLELWYSMKEERELGNYSKDVLRIISVAENVLSQGEFPYLFEELRADYDN